MALFLLSFVALMLYQIEQFLTTKIPTTVFAAVRILHFYLLIINMDACQFCQQVLSSLHQPDHLSIKNKFGDWNAY